MILCEHGGTSATAAEDLILFASQLDAAGFPARVAQQSIEIPPRPTFQFEAEPLLCAPAESDITALLILAAEEVGTEKMSRMRQLPLAPDVPVWALGRFSTAQKRINTLSRLSYVFGQDPELLDLSDDTAVHAGKRYAFGAKLSRYSNDRPVVMILAPDLENQAQIDGIYALSLTQKFKTLIVCNGKSKGIWQKKFGRDTPVFQFDELPPADMSRMADICVWLTDIHHNPRAATILNSMLLSGVALVNGTGNQLAPDEFSVRGPVNTAHLADFLLRDILPNMESIGHAAARSNTAAEVDISRIAKLAGLAQNTPSGSNPASKSVFVPTNGVGLGHAQRCSLIASALQSPGEVTFAAFPSCLPMLNRYGFDGIPLVSRSGEHVEPHANDLLNYLRLSSLCKTGDTLVFDGGYVFDSIFRTIARHGLQSAWIRRGLWQAGQNNSIALDREKIFDRVIVPSEAFDELNATYSNGDHLETVGPIVQRIEPAQYNRDELRERLRKRFGHTFDKLVVTMLGGGVAADRTAQIQAISAEIERRNDTVNLVVTWPTAKVDPGWFSWKNTYVVRTHHALPLVAASDLFISAVGYNSFHEVLYNRIPAIFIPQMATFMDDQAARAEAAAKRNAAILVEPDHLLRLNREISACLDGSKSNEIREALSGLNLPEPGTRAAAQIIAELSNAA